MKLPSKQISERKRLYKERLKLKKFLKRGDLLKVASMADVNVQVVYRWFKGNIINSSVEPYVEHLAKLRMRKVKQKINDEI